MSNYRALKAIDQRDAGDLNEYFRTFDNIFTDNSGVHDNRTLSIDSSEPPCPVQKGQYTKIKLTDDSLSCTNIDKSWISATVSYTITGTVVEEYKTLYDEELKNVDDMIDAVAGLTLTGDFIFDDPLTTTYTLRNNFSEAEKIQWVTNTKKQMKAARKAFSNKTNRIFIGLKSGIHILDAYRIYSNNKKTMCEQTEALYENAVAYMCKSKDETCHRPHMYSDYEKAYNLDGSVCGVYVPLDNFISSSPTYNGGKETLVFEVCIPFDDFLPLSGFTIFPNCVFGNLSMELKQTILGNLVNCQVCPSASYYKNHGSFLDEVTLVEFDNAISQKSFSQLGDDFNVHFCNIRGFLRYPRGQATGRFCSFLPYHQKAKISLTCTNGTIESCRAYINGFNIKSEVQSALSSYYSTQKFILPAQFIDYQAFSQTPQSNGVKCNTTYSLTNITNIICTFPRTGNQITCSFNPNFSSIQLQIDSKPFPDKPFSTNEASHSEFVLTNTGLDTLWPAQKSLVDSLMKSDLEKVNYLNESGEIVQEYKRINFDTDRSSYMFNVATERLCGYGNFQDGLSKDNSHLSLDCAHLVNTVVNPYLYPDGTNKNVYSPYMMFVQDAFWEFSAGQDGAFVINDKQYIPSR